MKKYCVLILTVFCIAVSCSKKINEKNIIFKHGVATYNNKALYLDPNKLENPGLEYSKEYRENYKSNILPNSIIGVVEGNELWIYSSEKDDPYFKMVDTKRMFKFKIENYELLLSLDGKDWEPVKVSIVNENPNVKNVAGEEVLIIIKLECKWFNGEYEISGY